MKLIQTKKQIYPVPISFDQYLREFGRSIRLSLDYDDLLDYDNALPLYDKKGEDSLWSTLTYGPSRLGEIEEALLKTYAFLRTEGDMRILSHLKVDRVDLCLYGNTQPFRVRIINTINENFDYFYVKRADCSRLLGLELEHILSPNRIGFFYFEDTLVEDHIYGIPGDLFLQRFATDPHLNKTRLAKEFVKFNERCLLRLLGDMHSANFVVDITMDFEENFYRLRAIDFDQQCYEPVKKVYMPQFFPQNAPFVEMVMDTLTKESIDQYQQEERVLIRKRLVASDYRITKLFDALENVQLAPRDHVLKLREALAAHYGDEGFTKANSMIALLKRSLALLDEPR